MNIFLLFSQPWGIGGAESHVTSLIRGLRTRGHAVTVSFHGDQPIPAFADDEGIVQVPLTWRTSNPMVMRATYRRLIEIVNSREIEILHAHQRTAGIFAALLHRRCRLPYTITLHDLWAKHFRLLMRPFWSEANIAVSAREREYFHQAYGVPLEKLVVIENGIDVEAFSDHAPVQPDAHAAPILLFVARLNREKSRAAQQLIHAATLIHPQQPVTVHIAGDGPYFDTVAAAADAANRMLGGDVVRMLGRRTDVPDLIRDATLALGTGRFAAESMMMGKPLVALYDDVVFMGLVTPENFSHVVSYNFAGPGNPVTPRALADAILPVLQNARFRDELGQFSARSAREQLSIDRMVDRTIALYASLQQHRVPVTV